MKILFAVNNLRSCNGVTTVIMSQYKKIIQAGYEVDFLQIAHRESIYITEIENNGGHIFTMPSVETKLEKATFDYLRMIFKDNEYDIVHVNLTDLYAVLILRAAKKAGVKNIIYHSHNTKIQGSFKVRAKTYIYDPLCVYYANTYVACSQMAGKSIFGKRSFTVIRNVLDSSKYAYDEEKRSAIRYKLGISEGDIVIGTVGRYAEQKNPLFAINIFLELRKKYDNLRYIWVGSGGIHEDEVRTVIKNNNWENCFFMVGSQDNANEWYSAFDLFVLPSLFEGFGNVLIEAQASGLPTFTSDKVPVETQITELIHYLPITIGCDVWVNEIDSLITEGIQKRSSQIDKVIAAGFDSISNDSGFVEFYEKLS